MDLAARHAADRCIEYGGVHRFTDPAYADLSLRMRSGARPGEVFDEPVRSGDVVIHPSEVERQDVLAAKAANGQLVVADTREQVARINHVAHRVRVVTGRAADYVITASGEQIGTGDTIATRQNDAEVGVANREMWTVIGSSAAGLHVKGASGQRVLSPPYVHDHVELAYATTAYGAQGSTVDTAHVVIGEHTGAAPAYVGMTRGRERNVAHLVAESIEDAHSSGSRCSAATAPTSVRHTPRVSLRKPSTATARCRLATPAAPRHPGGAPSRISPIGHRSHRRLLASASDVTELPSHWRAGNNPAAVGALRHD